MFLQQQQSGNDKQYGPESCNSLHVQHIEIAQQKQTTKNHQRDAAPEISVFCFAKLLLKPVDWGLQFDALGAQLSFLRRVIRVKWHVAIERGNQQSNQRLTGA